MASVGGTPIFWGTAYANNAEYVYLGSAYANNAKPVYESPAGGSPVCIGTAYANNASPVYMASCFPKSTLEHTRNGEYVPIGFLKEGDSLVASIWPVIVSRLGRFCGSRNTPNLPDDCEFLWHLWHFLPSMRFSSCPPALRCSRNAVFNFKLP